MKELFKMIFFMDLENMFGKIEIFTEVYFNLGKDPNLDMIFLQETNTLDFINKIKIKESD